MSSEKDHIIYTAEDIQKYLSGKLVPAEMHAMEKAALDDAFLAEAMEGYSVVKEEEWEKQLMLVKQQMDKVPLANVVPLNPAKRYRFWKIAAAILVIGSGMAITYLLTTKENPAHSIAAISSAADSINPVIVNTHPATDTNKMIASIKARQHTVPDNKEGRQMVPLPAPERSISADSTFMYHPGIVNENKSKSLPGGGHEITEQQNKLDVDATNNSVEPLVKNNAVVDKAKSNNLTLSKSANKADNNLVTPAIIRKFGAQVVSADGTPLPFANISITKNNVGTYTDAKGHFQLLSADTLLHIEVKSAGYITRSFTLNSAASQDKIILVEDELALKDKTQVTATPYNASKKRKAVLVPDSIINVEPADGWNNYDTYITNNLSIPGKITEEKIHGEVAISFDVQTNGAITNVKVDKSLCGDCDEAALRAIKEGPKWKIKKGSQATGKVKVKF